MVKVMVKRVVFIIAIISLFAIPATAYITGFYVSPTGCDVADDAAFRAENDCRSVGNDSACFWRLNCQIGLGGDYSNFMSLPSRYKCYLKTEEECWRTVGQASIDWTNSHWPQKAEDHKQAVNQILYRNFGSSGETNTAPVAVPDSYTVEQDTALTVPAPGLLGNDTDADGDALIARIRTYASHGMATVHQDGSFSYTPNDGFVGEDSFGYVVDDGTEDSQVATVTITVTEGGVEPPPDCEECQAALAAAQAELATLKQDVQTAISALQGALDNL